ncbi:MAG: hypothetical protein JXX28_20070 [Deltaproteobacteria bacterium]|nr:hypothetical protein [Deltaproteobacteria bacterium]
MSAPSLSAQAIAKGADGGPLPPGALLRLQVVKVAGDGCGSNHRLLLTQGGAVFLQENRAADCANRPPGSAFNTPFDQRPRATLGAEPLDALRAALLALRATPAVTSAAQKDGAIQVLDADLGGAPLRRVGLQGACPQLDAVVELLWRLLYPR